MRGNVLGFDLDTNIGAISGHDGQRYEFVRLEWRGSSPPAPGEVVDFVAEGNRARQIYSLAQHFDPPEASTANTVYVLYLVGLLAPLTSIFGVVWPMCIAPTRLNRCRPIIASRSVPYGSGCSTA